MSKFIADGEFGTHCIEADDHQDAAEQIATKFAGLDSDEICQDPFTFSIANIDTIHEYRAEWSPASGLTVTCLN